jgi:hypothetical protein
MAELAISIVIIVLLTAIAVPTLMNSLRSYQLNDAAARVSDLLKFTRFEAVRKNTTISMLLQQTTLTDGSAAWTVGVSSNGAALDANGRREIIVGFATLLPQAGLPAPNNIAAYLGVPPASLNILSGNQTSVTFDSRGAVRVGGNINPNVDVIYIGSTTNGVTPDPKFGFRAVVILPAGGTQLWLAPPNANGWQRMG